MIETYAPTFIVEIGGKELPEDISAHIERFSYEESEKQMDELKLTITKGDMSYVDNPLLQEVDILPTPKGGGFWYQRTLPV